LARLPAVSSSGHMANAELSDDQMKNIMAFIMTLQERR
jgi:hypothetical protein